YPPGDADRGVGVRLDPDPSGGWTDSGDQRLGATGDAVSERTQDETLGDELTDHLQEIPSLQADARNQARHAKCPAMGPEEIDHRMVIVAHGGWHQGTPRQEPA